MAVVRLKFIKRSKEGVEYVTKDRGEDDVFHAEGCNADGATEAFKYTRDLHRAEDGNAVLRIIQSWSPEESVQRTPEEFNLMGRQLTEELFPGYQYVIRTHTDKAHFHNHIAINTVHPETGDRITNNRFWCNVFHKAEGDNTPERGTKGLRLIDKIRRTNDRICLEHGLSVITEKGKSLRPHLTHEVEMMMRFKKDSWVLGIVQKANFARSFATSYDEYTTLMKLRGVNVRVENKNISYALSEDPSKKKRGKSIGEIYDKSGLERNFKFNDEYFKLHPEIRALRQKEFESLQSSGRTLARDSGGLPLEPNGPSSASKKDYTKYTPVPRANRGGGSESHLEFKDSPFPLEALKNAKKVSILEYCHDNKIAVSKHEDGNYRLGGRNHIVLKDSVWTNEKSRVSGDVIDFVKIHKNMTDVQAIAHLAKSPRLLLLEDHLGSQKMPYQSFHIPKPERHPMGVALDKVKKLLTDHHCSHDGAASLVNSEKVHVGKSGIIRLVSEHDESACLELEQDTSGKWKKRHLGNTGTPFLFSRGRSRSVTVFSDPFSYFQAAGGSSKSQKKNHSTLVLFEQSTKALDVFLSRNEHVEELKLATSKPSKSDLDFFNVIKRKYAPYGVRVELDHSPELSRSKETPSLER